MALGWPWSYNPLPGGGLDVHPDGCTITYLEKEGLMRWISENGACGIRAPLTNQNLDWIDKSGVLHKGISQAERDKMYELWGKTYDKAHTVNRAATEEELAIIRGMLNTSADSTATLEDKPAVWVDKDDNSEFFTIPVILGIGVVAYFLFRE